MTRLFLEIKNIPLCAEASFFILLYFLCENLLSLCAEHHYPLERSRARGRPVGGGAGECASCGSEAQAQRSRWPLAALKWALTRNCWLKKLSWLRRPVGCREPKRSSARACCSCHTYVTTSRSRTFVRVERTVTAAVVAVRVRTLESENQSHFTFAFESKEWCFSKVIRWFYHFINY